MTDSPQTISDDRADSNKLPPIDVGSIILSGGPSVSQRYRAPQMQQEKGPAPSTQPRSNRDKFPDTSKDWWPTDKPVPQAPGWPFSKEDAPGGWGVHRFVTPPAVPQPWPPPDRPTGPVPDGPILKPDPIQPPRISDDDARKSSYINADARSIYLTAAGTGAGMKVGTHLADLYTGSVEPSERTGMVAFWRNNLSPSQRLVPERAEVLKTAQDALPGLSTEAHATASTFVRQERFRAELATDLLSQIPSGPLPATESAWYNARVDLVRNDNLFRAENIIANTGTDAQVQLRQKLFTQTESTQLVTQANDFWQSNSSALNAEANLKAGEAAKNRAVQMLTQAERGSITTTGEALLRGAGAGLLLGTATVAADNLLDRALGNSPELANQAHWGIQGIGMPLLLLSRASLPGKVIGSLAMVGGSHVMDRYLGPPTGMFSAFARPSLPEIGLATAGALTPVRDIRVRAALAAGGWALGKTWNYLDARYEITGKTEPRMRDEALAAVDYDMKSPSKDRFMFAADQVHKFSDKNDAAASVMIKDWQGNNNSVTSIEKERGTAALMLGLGESMLARGTRIDQIKWDKEGKRMLAGTNYDLGGQATSFLRSADGNLQNALNLAQENKGKNLSSGVINDAYINQLKELKAASSASLDKVYGGHNIPAVYDEVKKEVSAYGDEMRSYGENLAQYAKTISETEPRFKAKISRDLAILHTAFGELDPTPGGRTEHFKNAMRYLEQAARLDPGAADQPAVLALLRGK